MLFSLFSVSWQAIFCHDLQVDPAALFAYLCPEDADLCQKRTDLCQKRTDLCQNMVSSVPRGRTLTPLTMITLM